MSVKTFVLPVCLALAVAGCGGGSRADNAPIRALLSADALMLVSFDADADLSVTRAEAESGIAREFARADANADGALSPIEFQNWSNLVLGGTQIGPFRLDFDRNVDNTITREEFETELRARVTSYDADENGAISRPEFVRLVGQARPPAPERRLRPEEIGSQRQ